MNPNRQPAGIPNGGQFAPGSHPESPVELGAEDDPPCDAPGCERPSIDCVGGEVYYCAEHEDVSGDLYWAWREDPERARRVEEQRQSASSDDAARRLIDEHFDGDAARAVLAVARAGGVAVAYQDRSCFESDFRPLSDEEWDLVRPELEDYDEWLDNSGAGPSIVEWRSQVLERVGIAYGDDEGDYCFECGAESPSGFRDARDHERSCSLHPDNTAGLAFADDEDASDGEDLDECGVALNSFGFSIEHDPSCSLHPDNVVGP